MKRETDAACFCAPPVPIAPLAGVAARPRMPPRPDDRRVRRVRWVRFGRATRRRSDTIADSRPRGAVGRGRVRRVTETELQADHEDHGDQRPKVEARDARGKWLPGKSGNPIGRPRNEGRPRLYRIARDVCEKNGLTLEQALGAVIAKLLQAAAAGDFRAAELVLDRLSAHEPKVDAVLVRGIDGEPLPVGPPMPQGAALATYLREFAEQLEAFPRARRRGADDGPGAAIAEGDGPPALPPPVPPGADAGDRLLS